jgi:hypothetical protein
MPQVWLLDEWNTSSGGDLAKAVSTKASQLGASLPVRHKRGSSVAGALPSGNDVVVVFAGPENTSHLPARRPAWMSVCDVVPVVENAADVPSIRDYLRQNNAFVRTRFPRNHWADVLTDDVLARALLARHTRNVFISYVRADRIGVARQLADRLMEDGFGVFLDERSISVGARFDREIAYRLDDADVLILLASPGLQHSRWVQRELNFARQANIAILVVDLDRHPDTHLVVRSAMPYQRFRPATIPAKPADELATQDLTNLLGLVYRMRIGSVVRRAINLMPAATTAFAAAHGGATLTPGPEVGEFIDAASGDILRVLPFRPTIDVLWRVASRSPTQHAVRVVYPEAVPRDSRVRALRWAFLPHRPQTEILHVRQLF